MNWLIYENEWRNELSIIRKYERFNVKCNVVTTFELAVCLAYCAISRFSIERSHETIVSRNGSGSALHELTSVTGHNYLVQNTEDGH